MPPARSRAASSSASRARRRRPSWPCASPTGRSARSSRRATSNDVQIVLTVLSTDQENDPDILALNGASAALAISSIPFLGPVGARPRRPHRRRSSSPTRPTRQLDESELDLVVAGTREAVMMVEAGAKILPESVMADAIDYGHAELQQSIDLQEKLVGTAGKPKKHAVPRPEGRLDRQARQGASPTASPSSSSSTSRRPPMKPENGYIVDIAALRVRDGKVVDRFESLVNPGRSIVGHQIHGISDDDVANAPTAAEVLTQASPSGSATRRSSPTTSASTCRSCCATCRTTPAGSRPRSSTRSSWPTSSIPMRAATSSATSCASSSVVTTSPRIARCRTRRRPPSCSST